MGDEDGIVMVKITVANTGPRHMGHRVVTGQFDDLLVAGQNAICGQGKRFVGQIHCPDG